MTMAEPTGLDAAEVQRRLDELLWYHTIDVAPGATTKGWFDLRHALPSMPFPDVKGKRCLDIGTWDGFYAHELAKRGAAEVVAVDIPDLSETDYPPEVREDPTFDHSYSGTQPRNAGFHLIKEILGSPVQWHGCNIYDLDPEELGTFDVVILGSLLVHLRDPVRALDRVRRMVGPGGVMLSVDYIHPFTNLMARRRPLFELRGKSADMQWWLASDRGLQHLLHVGGFEVIDMSPRFLLRPGDEYPHKKKPGRSEHLNRPLNWLFARDLTPGGHLHRAYLTRPRF